MRNSHNSTANPPNNQTEKWARSLNSPFSGEATQVAQQERETTLTVAPRLGRTETPLTPDGEADIHRARNSKCGENVEKGWGNPCTSVGMSVGAASVESALERLQKMQHRTAGRPSRSTPGTSPKKMRTLAQKAIGPRIPGRASHGRSLCPPQMNRKRR